MPLNELFVEGCHLKWHELVRFQCHKPSHYATVHRYHNHPIHKCTKWNYIKNPKQNRLPAIDIKTYLKAWSSYAQQQDESANWSNTLAQHCQ